MKILYFIPVASFSIVLLLIYFSFGGIDDIRSSECSVVKCKYQQIFIYRDGTALNLAHINKLKVCNPWPGHYEVRASVGWDIYIIQPGFSNREEAENWLQNFLQESIKDA